MVTVKIKINQMEFSEEEARQIYEHLKKYFGKTEYVPVPVWNTPPPVWLSPTLGNIVEC